MPSPSLTERASDLSDLYDTEPATIAALVSMSPTVVATLRAAHEQILRTLGPARCRLTIERDPDVAGDQQIVVRIPCRADEAVELLDRFDTQWWLAAARAETAPVCFLPVPR